MPTYEIPIRLTLEVSLTLTVEDVDAEHATVLAARVVDGMSVASEDILSRGGKLDADIEVGESWIGEPLPLVASDDDGDEVEAEPRPEPVRTIESPWRIPRNQYRGGL